ncbi:MAG: Maf family protein [Firmicutes bacterium]|nr:Maf family protein [Bacillota bacterium]
MFFKKQKNNFILGILFGVIVLLSLLLPYIYFFSPWFPAFALAIVPIQVRSAFAENPFFSLACLAIFAVFLSGVCIIAGSAGGLATYKRGPKRSFNKLYKVLLFIPISLLALIFILFAFGGVVKFVSPAFYIDAVAFCVFPASTIIKERNISVLASASPRRAELIKKVQAQFEDLCVSIIPSAACESVFEGERPDDYSLRVAKLKAEEVFEKVANPDAVVLGCDTVVTLDGRIFGKPASAQEALEMFQTLCGRTHEVITGVYLVRGGKSPRSVGAFQKTRVTFAPFDEALVKSYIGTGAPLDKAGGYGLQDPQIRPLIKKVEGCRDNVVGLPMELVTRLLREFF